MGIRQADHATPLYPPKLALTSPTSGGYSGGIVRLRTKAAEFFRLLILALNSESFRRFYNKIILHALYY
jgi:hypothetical protein